MTDKFTYPNHAFFDLKKIENGDGTFENPFNCLDNLHEFDSATIKDGDHFFSVKSDFINLRMA